jgi:hypothetical protein
MTFPTYQTPSFTLIQNHKQNHNFIYFNLYVFRQQTRSFWTEWWKALSEFLISSWIKFWFVTVVPRYLNFAIFSKDLFTIFILWFCSAFWWWEISQFALQHLLVHQSSTLAAKTRGLSTCHFCPVLEGFWSVNDFISGKRKKASNIQ